MIEVSQQLTPAGEIQIAVLGDSLVGLGFLDGWPRVKRHLLRQFRDDELRNVRGHGDVGSCLDAYMRGKLDSLAGIAVDTGGTSFQHRCWSAISGVPPGQTCSYAELAAADCAPRCGARSRDRLRRQPGRHRHPLSPHRPRRRPSRELRRRRRTRGMVAGPRVPARLLMTPLIQALMHAQRVLVGPR